MILPASLWRHIIIAIFFPGIFFLIHFSWFRVNYFVIRPKREHDYPKCERNYPKGECDYPKREHDLTQISRYLNPNEKTGVEPKRERVLTHSGSINFSNVSRTQPKWVDPNENQNYPKWEYVWNARSTYWMNDSNLGSNSRSFREIQLNNTSHLGKNENKIHLVWKLYHFTYEIPTWVKKEKETRNVCNYIEKNTFCLG